MSHHLRAIFPVIVARDKRSVSSVQLQDGSASGSVTPKLASEGPIARKRTLFASPSVMMIPPMETLSPVSTSNLVETFSDWAGTVGSGVGVGEELELGKRPRRSRFRPFRNKRHEETTEVWKRPRGGKRV